MSKKNSIIYWISTLWLALGMFSTGLAQLFRSSADVDFMTGLGYPVYLTTLLGIWKILGAAAVLVPKFPILKEWAYAGFFFAMTGAIFSHLANGEKIVATLPALLLLALTLVSWYFRPAARKIAAANQ